jgi:hypothetical protein
MKPWLNWTYVVRALGVATMGLGVLWHEGSLVIAGLGVAGAPTAFGWGK